MSVIKIKRSGTSGAPPSLAQGELAYSYLDGSLVNGGDRLYVGVGTEVGGNAASIDVIGGKYFTSKLDHEPGVLTSNSAVLVDANSKIDLLKVDDLTLDGHTVASSTDLILDPVGVVDVSGAVVTNLGAPTANTDSTTKLYVDTVAANATANAISSFIAGEGIDITDNGNGTRTIDSEIATYTNRGVASFDNTNFTVSSGAVSILEVDGGAY
jgi:hypothetical protein